MEKSIIFCGVIVVFIALAGFIIYTNHPILLKWCYGSARVIGKPINANVYTDGHINNDIKVFGEKTYWHGKKADKYILKLAKFDKYGMLKFINIHLDEKWVGKPASTNEVDYDVINGYLFQSDVSYLSSDFRDDMEGFNFDPHLQFTDKEIKFNIPPKLLKFDSLRIELSEK